MNRLVAVLLALGIILLVIVSTITEPRFDEPTVIGWRFVIHFILGILSPICLFVYCGFAAIHAIQHLTSPKDRSVWLILTVVLNLFGACWYYLTVYQTFRKQGQGGLMTFEDPKPRPILNLISRCCVGISLLGFAWILFVVGQNFYRGYKAQQDCVVAFDYTFARKELNLYYSLHGSYPKQLTGLGLPTDPKRGTNQALTPFDYESDGHHFTLHWKIPNEREVYLEGRDGATIRDDWVAQLKQERISTKNP